MATNYTASDLATQGEHAFEKVEYELAVQFYTRALEVCESPTELISISERLGEILVLLERHQDAIEVLHRACMADMETKNFPRIWMECGQLNQGEHAYRYYEVAVEILDRLLSENECEDTRKALSSLYCTMAELYCTDLCDHDDADVACKQLLGLSMETYPRNPEVYIGMANLSLITGDRVTAMSSLESFVALVNDNVDVAYEIRMEAVKMFFEIGRPMDAAELAESLLEENDESAEIWGLAAMCYASFEPETSKMYFEGMKKKLGQTPTEEGFAMIQMVEKSIIEGTTHAQAA